MRKLLGALFYLFFNLFFYLFRCRPRNLRECLKLFLRKTNVFSFRVPEFPFHVTTEDHLQWRGERVLSFLLHSACHGCIPFFSAPFDDSQEAEGKERLALFSAFPKSIWSTARGMWLLWLNSDSASSVHDSVFIMSPRIWGMGKCASLFWVLLKGAVSSVGQCLRVLPETLLNPFWVPCLRKDLSSAL